MSTRSIETDLPYCLRPYTLSGSAFGNLPQWLCSEVWLIWPPKLAFLPQWSTIRLSPSWTLTKTLPSVSVAPCKVATINWKTILGGQVGGSKAYSMKPCRIGSSLLKRQPLTLARVMSEHIALVWFPVFPLFGSGHHWVDRSRRLYLSLSMSVKTHS